MSTDNFGALGADFFIKTYDKGSTMSQADLDALVQYVQLTTTIIAIGDFTPGEQDSVWMILERVDVPSAPGYTVTNNTDVTMTSSGMVTIDSIPWTKVTGKPNFATVATSGSYADLSDKPAAQILQAPQWNELHNLGTGNRYLVGDLVYDNGTIYQAILTNESQYTAVGDATYWRNLGSGIRLQTDYLDLANKPTLFSGSYTDLTSKPTIPTDVSDLTDTTSLLGGDGTTLPTNASGYLVNDGSGNLSWAAGDGTFSGNYNDLTNKPTIRIAVPTGAGPGGNLQADSLALAGLNPVTDIASTWGGDLILQGGVGGANGDLYGEVRIKSGQIGANYEWHFTTDRKIKLPAGGSIVDSTGATAFVSLATLKQVVAASTDFTDFQSRIAGM